MKSWLPGLFDCKTNNYMYSPPHIQLFVNICWRQIQRQQLFYMYMYMPFLSSGKSKRKTKKEKEGMCRTDSHNYISTEQLSMNQNEANQQLILTYIYTCSFTWTEKISGILLLYQTSQSIKFRTVVFFFFFNIDKVFTS